MTQRLNAFQTAPDAYKAMRGLQDYVDQSQIEHSLQELVKIRASQLNRCAYCLHMHMADARKAGESEARITLLSAWEESELYTPRERAALTWAETLTRIEQTQAPDADYEALKAEFSEAEQVNLTFAIGAINVWNRLAVGFRLAHPAEPARVAA